MMQPTPPSIVVVLAGTAGAPTTPTRPHLLPTVEPTMISTTRTTPRSATTLLVALAASLVMAGCDSVAENAAEQIAEQAVEASGSEGNVEVDTDTGEISIDIASSEGSSEGTRLTVGGGDIPDDFPEQFVLPEDGDVRAVTKLPGSVGVQVTSGSLDAFEATRESLVDDAWESVSESTAGDLRTATYRKGGVQVTVGALGEGDEYVLTYNYTTEPVSDE